MRVSIIVFPGSNCDRDMMLAIESITSRRPALIWHKERQMDNADLVIIPGGFSFGDYLRCGALAARSPAMEAVLDHASRGGAVLGVCNGFQILLEAGLLPGTLVKNKALKFVCRTTQLGVQDDTQSPLLAGCMENGMPAHLNIPVAHNEGNYFAPDDELDALEANGQIAFKYHNDGITENYNPNGAARDIAGVLSANKRILGMMPHPERAMGNGHGSADGKRLLSSIIEGVSA